ncbi:hypothetical protein BH10CYA1_BH10CYA1_35750 [soil metagenome]
MHDERAPFGALLFVSISLLLQTQRHLTGTADGSTQQCNFDLQFLSIDCSSCKSH